MTLPMILALAVLIVMIVLIMTDVLPFGAPPLLACLLLVVVGLSTVPEAFAGFTNSSVLMIAFFMVPLAAMQKTRLIGRVKRSMGELVKKGGYKSYALLIVVVMLGASLAGTGATGYYVLVVALVSTIPYEKKLPTSKLMMPLGLATNHPLAPVNVALIYGVMITALEASGYTGGVSMVSFALVNLIVSVGFLAWALVAYRLLPDHPIADPAPESSAPGGAAVVSAPGGGTPAPGNGSGPLPLATGTNRDLALRESDRGGLPAWKEYATGAMFVVSVVAMMLLNVLGDLAYVVPGLCAFALLFIRMVDFKEFRESLFAPVILMMAGVIGVADALAKSGLTGLVGNSVADMVGSSVSPFVLVLVFALLTSTAAAFTGSNLGSVAIFAPIAIATFLSLGLNPVAAACAVAVAGWNGHYMPIDGLPAMIFGMGRYKLTEFWKFTVPMYLIRILVLSAGAVLIFPV
ncbi:SLC13 family permease [Promicromonospora sukumoe]|uniref:Na+/H+ antiporter NhaD/arsenite permease-like protein n=1 Tax=Promicromonospora sukumoe TaxID=88382 RepID=A0A7W3PDV5_9MICO|nr:SLC13 family permease [Promicromonospora sukumoe]MBA8808380.1 Na+/H+ antiporter NhaD/arsenite permease-like protein [Promicromonospora sukumoe]